MKQHAGPRVQELGYFGLEVSDLGRWERFATQVLGLRCCEGPAPNTLLLRMDEHRARFILTQGGADDLGFAGWQVTDAAALSASTAHLDAIGVKWTRGTPAELALRGVQGMVHFQDPGGNRHEIFHGPLLVSDRFSSATVASGFVTRGEGFGHFVLMSPAYRDIAAFAQQALGMLPSDEIRVEPAPGMVFEVAFFHANARHHSLAVAPQAPPPAPAKRIHHFMIEVNSIDDVGFARDRCLAMGLPVHMDIGQHPNDRMVSFYGETPSGFMVEFGCGGRKIDDATWQTVTYDKLSEWGHRPAPPPA